MAVSLLALGGCCLEIVTGVARFAPDGGGVSGGGQGVGCTPDSGVTVYAVSSSTLYAIDPVTWAPTLALSLGDPLGDLTDMAVSPTNEIYVTSFDTLYTVNLDGGALTQVIQHNKGFNALTFLANGTLLGAGGDGVVWKLDLTQKSVEQIGNFGNGYASSGDLVAVADGTLYATSHDPTGSPSDLLVKINPTTGAATPIGPTGFGFVWGLAYYGGEVIAFTQGGEVLKIDTQTGKGTALAGTSAAFYGAGVSPAVAAKCP